MKKKIIKRLTALVLAFVCAICIVPNGSIQAAVIERDPYSIKGRFVPELVNLTKEEIYELPYSEASTLFEKAFNVRASNYNEKEVRVALDGLCYAFKHQINARKSSSSHTSLSTKGVSSQIVGIPYSGDVGVAWVRDTTDGKSPLSLGEILSGTYTLEVDFLTWDSAALILVESMDKNNLDELIKIASSTTATTAATAIICYLLDMSMSEISPITGAALSIAIGFDWSMLDKIDKTAMRNCFLEMNKRKNQYMKVELTWTPYTVERRYSKITKDTTIANPFKGKYGFWYKDRYGYLGEL